MSNYRHSSDGLKEIQELATDESWFLDRVTSLTVELRENPLPRRQQYLRECLTKALKAQASCVATRTKTAQSARDEDD